jgi:mersacidin/lichenicidin family type 2 lantibiotic
MSYRKAIRAWKDEEYRLGLSEAEQAKLPAHPSGAVELSDADLGVVSGGVFTLSCTWGLECFTFFRCHTIACHTPSCPQ